MRVRRLSSLALFLCFTCLGQTPSVGSGAPNDTIAQRFYQAYIRNGFNLLVALPPVGNVVRFGTTGLIQLFQDAAKTSGVRLALIKATTTTALPPSEDGSFPIDVFQMQASMYSYYSSVGVGAAGYPVMDTGSCPPLVSNSCQYQVFDRNYVLFVYKDPILDGPNFSLRDPFFTKWSALGGISVLGPAATPEQSLTSKFGTTTRAQIYQQGALYNITSGVLNGRLLVDHLRSLRLLRRGRGLSGASFVGGTGAAHRPPAPDLRRRRYRIRPRIQPGVAPAGHHRLCGPLDAALEFGRQRHLDRHGGGHGWHSGDGPRSDLDYLERPGGHRAALGSDGHRARSRWRNSSDYGD